MYASSCRMSSLALVVCLLSFLLRNAEALLGSEGRSLITIRQTTEENNFLGSLMHFMTKGDACARYGVGESGTSEQAWDTAIHYCLSAVHGFMRLPWYAQARCPNVDIKDATCRHSLRTGKNYCAVLADETKSNTSVIRRCVRTMQNKHSKVWVHLDDCVKDLYFGD